MDSRRGFAMKILHTDQELRSRGMERFRRADAGIRRHARLSRTWVTIFLGSLLLLLCLAALG